MRICLASTNGAMPGQLKFKRDQNITEPSEAQRLWNL